MSGFEGDSKRRLIPRWRFSRDYGRSAEFQGYPRRKSHFVPECQFLDDRLSNWRASRSIVTAADAVACGLTYDRVSAVREPAEFLLDNADRTLAHVIRMAKAAMPTPESEHFDEQQLPKPNVDAKSQAIAVVREKRLHLREYPKNPLAYIDMARGYAILGQTTQAKMALRCALSLAPDHRVTLRLSSRFLVHVGDPKRAHDLLRHHPRTKSDPWLMAAEIAVASVAGRSAHYMKKGQQLLERTSLPPAHLTELYSAVATQLLGDGRTRAARQAFVKSLSLPTDNAVAQAHWARGHINSLSVSDSNMSIPRGYEARARRAHENLEWETARDEATQWQLDEPFSSRPASFGSYLGITLLGDCEFALQCTDIGLTAEPHDSTLLNNKAVALAYLGRVDEAFTTFKKISPFDDARLPTYVRTATAGLLNFRAGFFEAGRDHYRRARDLAPSLPLVQSRVLLHWASEEHHLQSEEAPKLRKIALEHLKKTEDPEIIQLEKVLLSHAPVLPTSVAGLPRLCV